MIELRFPKYHSPKWWFLATKETFKHILRNIICRKIFRITFGYTDADLLTLYIKNNSERIFNVLTRKYPEYKDTLDKYVNSEKPYAVNQFVCVGSFLYSNYSINGYWTKKGNAQDIDFLLTEDIPVGITIKLKDGSPHIVTLIKVDCDYIIYTDSLGDTRLNYIIPFGMEIREKKEDFLKRTKGPFLRLTFSIQNTESKKILKVKNYFKDRLYCYETKDYEGYKKIKNKQYVIQKFSDDGTVKIDLGPEAKNKFIQIYARFSTTEKPVLENGEILNLILDGKIGEDVK